MLSERGWLWGMHPSLYVLKANINICAVFFQTCIQDHLVTMLLKADERMKSLLQGQLNLTAIQGDKTRFLINGACGIKPMKYNFKKVRVSFFSSRDKLFNGLSIYLEEKKPRFSFFYLTSIATKNMDPLI
ncbi:hypothetical protein ACJX0J_023038 [Zea mays]